MPLHHQHEPYVVPESLVATLIGLGVAGVVSTGAQAWDSYPRGANPVNVVPNVANETDGAAATLIAAAAVTFNYFLTHLVFTPATVGSFQLRWKLQSSTPTIFRTLRTCSDFTVGPMSNMQSPIFPPFPVAANLGTQVILATSPGAGATQRAYVTALRRSLVRVDPGLQSYYSVSNGDVFPKSSGLLPGETDPTISAVILGVSLPTSDATSWNYGPYVEITPGISTPCLVTAVWGNTGDSVDHVQATYASGPSGGEVPWGTFAWPQALNSSDPSDCRHNLLPFPLYLPANTRLAGKARSNGTVPIDFRTSLEYVALPLR